MHAIRASDVGGEPKLPEKQDAVDIALVEANWTHNRFEQVQFTCDTERVPAISITRLALQSPASVV